MKKYIEDIYIWFMVFYLLTAYFETIGFFLNLVILRRKLYM